MHHDGLSSVKKWNSDSNVHQTLFPPLISTQLARHARPLLPFSAPRVWARGGRLGVWPQALGGRVPVSRFSLCWVVITRRAAPLLLATRSEQTVLLGLHVRQPLLLLDHDRLALVGCTGGADPELSRLQDCLRSGGAVG